jgi:hypothetical protein
MRWPRRARTAQLRPDTEVTVSSSFTTRANRAVAPATNLTGREDERHRLATRVRRLPLPAGAIRRGEVFRCGVPSPRGRLRPGMPGTDSATA